MAFFAVKVQFGSIFWGWPKTAPSGVTGKETSGKKPANLYFISLYYVLNNFVTDETEKFLETLLEFLHFQKDLLSIKLEGSALAELLETRN